MPEPTPILEYGNDLTNPILQSGWTFETDGFGLIQSQCKFKWSLGNCINEFPGTQFSRGASHPLASGGGPSSRFANLKVWKASYVVEKNGIATVTADYIGVDNEYPGVTSLGDGVYATLPQCSVSGSCSTEDITHHPNFLKLNVTNGGFLNVLAIYPDDKDNGYTPYRVPADGGVIKNPNRVLWQPRVRSGGAQSGWEFVDFLPAQPKESESDKNNQNIKAGVKSYYRGMPSIKATIYISGYTEASALAGAMNLVSLTGWVNDGSAFNLPQNIKALATPGFYDGSFIYSGEWTAKIHRNFLITNVGVEQYGKTFKVVADLAISGIGGWDKDIYPIYESS